MAPSPPAGRLTPWLTRPVRRRLGDAVINGPRPAIDLDPFQPCWVGVLQILDHPKAAAVAELDEYRLADLRFARDELDAETVGKLHPGGSLF